MREGIHLIKKMFAFTSFNKGNLVITDRSLSPGKGDLLKITSVKYICCSSIWFLVQFGFSFV